MPERTRPTRQQIMKNHIQHMSSIWWELDREVTKLPIVAERLNQAAVAETITIVERIISKATTLLNMLKRL